jgi:hypothetical protein
VSWDEFLVAVREAGGSTDMQTNETGRYPWLFHFCRDQAAALHDVVIYAHTKDYTKGPIQSPPRDWTTRERILADYAALNAHGAVFNDTQEALRELREAPTKAGT